MVWIILGGVFIFFVTIVVVTIDGREEKAQLKEEKINYMKSNSVPANALSIKYKSGIACIDSKINNLYGKFIQDVYENFNEDEYKRQVNFYVYNQKNASIYKNIQNKIRKHMKDNLRLNSLEKNLAVYEIESGLITFYVWLCNNNLCLLDSEENGVGQYQIALDDIISFLREGDIYSETNIKGGDSSIGGAILGGVIAGDTGAIIGSRRKITTENIRKDFRFTILEYKDKDKKGHAIFNSEAYDAFLKLIPSKEIKFVATGNRIEVTEPKEDIFEQIEKLDKLMKKGIVTEEEFISKKADLLNKI